jgi:hypothetical protein
MVTPAENAIYEIELMDRVIQFTSDELDGPPCKLNNEWLNITLVDMLGATREEYKEIVRKWLEMAQKPADTTSLHDEVGIWKEQFITLLSMTPVSDQKECLADGKSIWLEEQADRVTAWVPALYIDSFLSELGKDKKDKGRFLNEIIRSGITQEERSRIIRFSPKKYGTRRCWAVDPDYVQVEHLGGKSEPVCEGSP